MSKIYDLYSPDQRKIDNLKRRIRGYQKMEKDLNRDIRKTNNKNRELQQRIGKVLQILDNFDAWLEPQDTLKIKKCVEILKGDNNE